MQLGQKGSPNTNQVNFHEERMMLNRFQELEKDYTESKTYDILAKEFERTRETVERHVKRVKANKKELIIAEAFEKLEKGEPVNLYESELVQKEAIEIFANVLCDSGYEVSDKQHRQALKVIDGLSKKKPVKGKRALPE